MNTKNQPNPSKNSVWNTSQKGNLIHNALLPSIQSHPQMAVDMVGLLIISILDYHCPPGSWPNFQNEDNFLSK